MAHEVGLKDADSLQGENETQAGSQIHVEWTEEHEDILIEWADKAMCYRWLHSKAHHKYAKANAWFTIPVIIMSTTTGTANFAQERFPDNVKPWASMGIGAVNIFAGILTTIQQFLKISELNEAHRVASIAWDKFYRNTKVELAKSPIERTPVIQLLKHAKEEFERLMETSPSISDEIIKAFNDTFAAGVNKLDSIDQESLSARQRAYLDLKKPEICDTIETTRKTVYDRAKHEAMKPAATTITAIGLARKAVAVKQKQDKIEAIIRRFQETRNRLPTNQEICDELDGEVALDFVKDFVEKHSKAAVENVVEMTSPTGDENV